MIPIKLALRNFMCYRQPPALDFSGIHLACLAGDNGNGKSALIDAMTWALWGETRARTDEDLIHTAETEMEVEFEFMVGQQVYRIIRKRARPKKTGGTSPGALEFQIATPEGFKALSDSTVIQTQRQISEILHMDYKTFINSAYLKQGRADEFTRQTPAERKQVLGNILDLDYYTRLEERARNEARHQEALTAQLDRAIQEIIGELDLKPGLQAALQQDEAEFARIKQALDIQEASLKLLNRDREQLEQKRGELAELDSRQKGTLQNIALWQDQIALHHSKIQEYHKLISDSTAIEAGHARWQEARRINEQLYQDSRRVASLEQRQHEIEMAVTRAEQALVKDCALAQARVNELEARSRRLPELRASLKQVTSGIERCLEEENTLATRKELLQELVGQVSRLDTRRTHLEQELKEIAEKIKLLSAHVESHMEPRCPLCERDLAPGGLAVIESKYAAEKQGKTDLLKETQLQLARRKAELDSIRKEITATEAAVNHKKAALQNNKGILDSQIGEAEKADQDLVPATRHVAEMESLRAGNSFASAERAELDRIAVQILALGYSAQRHEQVGRNLAELEPYQNQKMKLDEAQKNIGKEQEICDRLAAALGQAKSSFEADSRRMEELKKDLVRLDDLLADIARVEGELKTARDQSNHIQERIWSHREKLARCAELEQKKSTKEKEAAEAARLEGIYQELTKAFGKGGIQALLIEQALPAIENEANRLLSKMTDNRMHIKFDTQRQNKTGGIIETLDINIADELGTRPYEMFSGGEAFRINFAIRIALSKLLARRAGAPLPTLIIDEGFGTQDASGIEKLKEAIISIQDEFQKILVITHIEELREAFPTRIDVIKTPQGSTISVN